MSRTPGTSINKLTLAQQVALVEFTKSFYTKEHTTDTAFAAEAEKALGFRVTDGNIKGVRNAFNIPSHKEARAGANPEARIAALEARVAALEAALARTDGTMGR